MKVANGVEMLKISSNIMGRQMNIYPALIIDDDAAILVDTGYPGQLPLIEEAVKNAGISIENLSLVIITHHDIDHIGNISGIKAKSPESIKISAHEIEAPYIQGDKKPLKLAQLEAKLESLPPDKKAFYERLKVGFQNRMVKMDVLLKDGEELPFLGGISVIHTPGHTLGHICLYLKQSKILIAGDMFNAENGLLMTSPESLCYDLEMYNNSLKKLTQYDIKAVICYHGGLFNGNVNERIKELISKQ